MPKGIYDRSKSKKSTIEKPEKKVVEKTAASAETPRVKRKYTRKADKIQGLNKQAKKMSRADDAFDKLEAAFAPKETEAGVNPQVTDVAVGHDILTGVVVDQTLNRLHSLAGLIKDGTFGVFHNDLFEVAKQLTRNLKDLMIESEPPKLTELVDEIKKIAAEEIAKEETLAEKAPAVEEQKVVLPKKLNGAAPVPVEAIPAPTPFLTEETKSEA